MKLIAIPSGSALALAGAAFATLMASAGSADALAIRLTDSVGSVTINDNQIIPPAGDTDPNALVIDFDSTLGPALAGGSHASVQAEVCNVGCANIAGSIEWDSSMLAFAETLTLEISHTGYTLLPLHWTGLHALGGVTPGTVTTEAFWSDTNTLFDAKYSIGGPFTHVHGGPGGFSSYSTDLFDWENGANPFSMTTIITITHGPNEGFVTEATTLAALAPVPVPAALPLLATAFGILGFVRSRRSA